MAPGKTVHGEEKTPHAGTAQLSHGKTHHFLTVHIVAQRHKQNRPDNKKQEARLRLLFSFSDRDAKQNKNTRAENNQCIVLYVYVSIRIYTNPFLMRGWAC